jgi:hypothetical protein
LRNALGRDWVIGGRGEAGGGKGEGGRGKRTVNREDTPYTRKTPT